MALLKAEAAFVRGPEAALLRTQAKAVGGEREPPRAAEALIEDEEHERETRRRRRKEAAGKHRREKKAADEEKASKLPQDSVYGEFVPSVKVSSTAAPAPPNAHQIDSGELTLGKVLGEGAFGKVYHAQWRGRDAAVKQLLKVADAKAVREFTREIDVMAAIAAHTNVVQLLGWTRFGDGAIGAVLELCTHGSLVTALYGASDQVLDWTPASQASMALDVARGLAHLHAHNVVHRDLAVRNLLLTFDNQIKVADFGMSRLTEHQDGGTTRTEVGPLRWLAYESLVDKKYSAKSDAWMFAVTLWEFFSQAELPFKHLDPAQVAIAVIKDDLRLAQPAGCPDRVYAMMQRCWSIEPTERPTLLEISAELQRAFDKLQKAPTPPQLDDDDDDDDDEEED